MSILSNNKKIHGKISGSSSLSGKTSTTIIYTDAYNIACANGFEGTIEEWLDSLKGEPGKDYVLTEADKQEIAGMVEVQGGGEAEDGFSPTVEVSKSGKVTTISITDKNGIKTATINDGADGKTPVKGTDYFTEAEKDEIARQAAQMVEAPDVDLSGYAKTEDIPTKPEDIGAQPKGDYALRNEIPSVPVKSVNGKTGAVVLSASDVNARPATWMPSAADVGARPSTWTPTYSDVGADKSGTASSAVSTHNTKTDAHNDIRLLITALTTRLDALANSDDDTLDQMAEVVAYIKANRDLIDQITTGKVSVTDIVNNLTTNVSNKPLSAAQGVALKALIDAITIPTKVSQLTNDAGYLTQHQDISGKLDASALPTAINTALAQAKESGEFDGKDGIDGISATHSWSGTTLTVTSASGTSSANLKGGKGDTGAQGIQGPKGDPGLVWKGEYNERNAYFVGDVVSLQGSCYVAVEDSGGDNPSDPPDSSNSFWNLLASKGNDGKDGADGKTPVKGTDYFTAADKAEMVNAVIAALPVYAGEVV